MAKRIKVRFNLSRGVNYLKWKVEYPDRTVYLSPTDNQLIMKSCQLKNYKKVAQRIFDGQNKQVCAWVLCEDIEIINKDMQQFDVHCDRIKYNPRVQPNWLLNGELVDNDYFKLIGSVDYGLYTINV